MNKVLLFACIALLFVSGCNNTAGAPPVSTPAPMATGIAVSPSSTTVQTGGVQQFTATVSPSGANRAVTWSVSGTGCAGASCGTIDATGKYTAPAAAPNPPTVTVTATSVADSTKAATASVTIITSGNNPIPTITGLGPNATGVGGPAFTLFVFGSNFVSSSVVRWNGSDRPTAFNNSTQVRAQIPASDIAATGTAAITVFNPAPGGGTSNSLNISIVAALGPVSVAVAPDPSGKFGKFAYVANSGSNNVSMYTIDATTGALTSIGRVAAGTNPASVTVDPFGKFAYVANNGSNNISMYTIDATNGALTSAGTAAAGTHPRSVAVDVSGRFAYVANAGSNNISMYTIDGTTGALTPAGTVAAETGPVSVAVDPSGRFAYVVNTGSNNISMYTIDTTTGALTSTGTIFAGTSPSSVAVSPSGKFAYAAWGGPFAPFGDVSMYTINSTTGALTSIGTAGRGTGIGPFVVVVHPPGKFAYVLDSGDILDDFGAGVSLYTINATSGTLTFDGLIEGLCPSSIAIDPSGKFGYVTDCFNDVSMYTIDPTTGALTLIGTIGT